MTARDLIKGSLRLLGAIATGETPSAEEQADALSALQDMLDSWSTEGLNIYAKTREEFSLIANQSSYTMGTGGDFNSARPMRIEAANVKFSGSNVEIPVEILTDTDWAEVRLKTTTSTVPLKIHPQGTYPLETFDMWPVPTSAGTLVLYSWKALPTFASSNADVTLPPGYARALRYNLAMELAPEFGKSVSAEHAAIAVQSKDNIKQMNFEPILLNCDDATLSSGARAFNILIGE